MLSRKWWEPSRNDMVSMSTGGWEGRGCGNCDGKMDWTLGVAQTDGVRVQVWKGLVHKVNCRTPAFDRVFARKWKDVDGFIPLLYFFSDLQ